MHFCYLNLAGITKIKYKGKTKGLLVASSKMMSLCQWPITVLNV